MDIKREKNWLDKERLVCYFTLLIEFLIVAFCYASKINLWTDTEFMTADSAILFSGIIISLLLIISLLICTYFNQLTVEKKILIILGSITISLSVLGLTDLVFENELTFFDIMYKSIQIFAGEFEYTSLYNRPVPPMVNIARFLGLFVTFGTIFTLILKQKIYQMSIWLFYRDVVIITNESEGFISDLANKFINDNRKVIIANTTGNDTKHQIISGRIPVIPVDIEKNINIDLKTCNIKNAKNIYLLCDDTKDNIRLAKAIYPLISSKNKTSEIMINDTETTNQHKTIDELIIDYFCLLLDNKQNHITPKTVGKIKKISCYIQYQTDEERKYYAIDEVFTKRTDNLATYFVNIDGICIRQMISRSKIENTFDFKGTSIDRSEDELNNISIAIAGSGEMLDRAIIEIAKNCVYNSKTPLKIYYLTNMQGNLEISEKISDIVTIESISYRDFCMTKKHINLFFIVSKDEKEVQNILRQVFQYDIQEQISEYMILTNGNTVEYNILISYLKSLLSPYKNGQKDIGDKNFSPRIFISNIKDLTPTIDNFYRKYAPTAKEIHDAYKKAIENKDLQDFNSLPERFIDSNILCAVHNDFILNVLKKWMTEQKTNLHNGNEESFKQMFKEFFVFLVITEHERWFNERSLQGYIYSNHHSNLYDKNASLLHWEQLSDQQQQNNIRYVTSTLIAQYKRAFDDDDIYRNVITEFNFDR